MVNIDQLDSENYIDESDKRPNDFELGIHPADNMLAKWKLLSFI
jgi:hypothetical protein